MRSVDIPQEFDDIRPYAPEEIPAAADRLLADADFRAQIVERLFPGLPIEVLRQGLHACAGCMDFQKKFIYAPLKKHLEKCSTGCDMDAATLPDKTANYTFISNHRDIVLDAAILDLLLVDNAFSTTVEIALGDNLLVRPWIEPLVKLNKSFLVRRRNVGIREMLSNSRLMSRYMHFAMKEKHENLWIAQREGRAKDSDDRTQEAVLKMLAMGGSGDAVESLKELNIVPLTISYEYDPCDFLKAKEFQQKRDNPAFRKSEADDFQNMMVGIMGYKGHIHYHTAQPVNTWIDGLASLPKGRLFEAMAQKMDTEIHKNYRIYPNNYVAADLQDGGTAYAGHYSAEDRRNFEHYLEGQLAKIDLPGKDEDFLRERLLAMYANPLRNYLKAYIV